MAASPSPFEANRTSSVRDDSFSSYLAFIRQSLSNELANNPSSRRASLTISVAPPKLPIMIANNNNDDDELDVFSAEKYYSCSLSDVHNHSDTTLTQTSSDSRRHWSSSMNTVNNKAVGSRSSTTSAPSSRRRELHQRAAAASACRRRILEVFGCYCSKKNFSEDNDETNYVSNSSVKPNRCLPSRAAAMVLQRESSSELFEIENVSLPGVYEPSEASITWSVMTASATNLSVSTVSASTERARLRRRSSPGFLSLSCVSEKAVIVSPDHRGGAIQERHSVGSCRHDRPAWVVGGDRLRRLSLG